MYEVIIEYFDRNNDHEIEAELAKSKRAANKIKNKYEENIHELLREYPDIYTVDKIYIKKISARINWGFLCIGILIAIILVVLDCTPKYKEYQETALAVSRPSTYQTQRMDFEDGVTYEIKLIAVFYNGHGYDYRDRLYIVFENDDQVKYTPLHVGGSTKTILQASEISKLTIGDVYKITKNGSDIKITK